MILARYLNHRAPAGIAVTTEPGRPATVYVSPGRSGAVRLGWLAEHRDALLRALAAHRALLIRGLAVTGPAIVAQLCRSLELELMVEREAFAPRQEHPGGVYSSIRWPPGDPICMHHELSYRLDVPRILVLACLQEASSGGSTSVADGRAVLADLPPALVERFRRVGWLLTRHYHPAVGVSWQAASGTDSPEELARYCQQQQIEWRTTEAGGLVTWQRRHAVTTDPATGEACWFNQIAFLNEWTMEPVVREYLRSELGPDGLPFNTCYGDGTPIEAETVDTIHRVYESHSRSVRWRAGDVMLVDNLAMAHARAPYTGDRRMVVAMADPVRLPGSYPSGGST
jgi:alpha-ketoglutarate-dependent taurine dioxygenase